MDKIEFQVVDLFAGPGGLAEGFSRLEVDGYRPFKIKISIEKDPVACQTLILRSFFRKFRVVPEEYYSYLRGEICKDQLFEAFPTESSSAKLEVWQAELGNEDSYPHESVFAKLEKVIDKKLPIVVIGGPPCQAYSLVGRSRMKSNPDFDSDPRHTLYLEYLKIIARIRPEFFIMENVKGLLSSKHKGKAIFPKILEDLKDPTRATDKQNDKRLNYVLHSIGENNTLWGDENFLVKSEDYGIPQTRHRIFILGVRSVTCTPICYHS